MYYIGFCFLEWRVWSGGVVLEAIRNEEIKSKLQGDFNLRREGGLFYCFIVSFGFGGEFGEGREVGGWFYYFFCLRGGVWSTVGVVLIERGQGVTQGYLVFGVVCVLLFWK